MSYFRFLCTGVFAITTVLCTSCQQLSEPKTAVIPPIQPHLNRPYEDSIFHSFDVKTFFEPRRNDDCIVDFTDEECIEKGFQKVPTVPEGLKLINNGRQGNYHRFVLENEYDHSSIDFGIISGLYDSVIFDFHFLLDDNQHSLFQIFFYYDEEALYADPMKYDASHVRECCGGPLFYHTAYYILASTNELMQQKKVEVGRQGDYILMKSQYFYKDIDGIGAYQKQGFDYLEGIKIIKFFN